VILKFKSVHHALEWVAANASAPCSIWLERDTEPLRAQVVYHHGQPIWYLIAPWLWDSLHKASKALEN